MAYLVGEQARLASRRIGSSITGRVLKTREKKRLAAWKIAAAAPRANLRNRAPRGGAGLRGEAAACDKLAATERVWSRTRVHLAVSRDSA